MRIAITTIRHMTREALDDYCAMLISIGVPVRTVMSFIENGDAEWTSADTTGPVTTRYEILKEA